MTALSFGGWGGVAELSLPGRQMRKRKEVACREGHGRPGLPQCREDGGSSPQGNVAVES